MAGCPELIDAVETTEFLARLRSENVVSTMGRSDCKGHLPGIALEWQAACMVLSGGSSVHRIFRSKGSSGVVPDLPIPKWCAFVLFVEASL